MGKTGTHLPVLPSGARAPQMQSGTAPEIVSSGPMGSGAEAERPQLYPSSACSECALNEWRGDMVQIIGK